MGNYLIDDTAVYLEAWQIQAALNTAPGYWPPRAINPRRPYFWKAYAPLEGVIDTSPLTSDYLHHNHGAPAQGAILAGLEGIRPGPNGGIVYALDGLPVVATPGPVQATDSGAWDHYFGEEIAVYPPTWAARLKFELMQAQATRIGHLTDGEAIPMGLSAFHTYTRGSGLPLIKDAWDRGMLIEELYYDRNPVIIGYTLKRIE